MGVCPYTNHGALRGAGLAAIGLNPTRVAESAEIPFVVPEGLCSWVELPAGTMTRAVGTLRVVDPLESPLFEF